MKYLIFAFCACFSSYVGLAQQQILQPQRSGGAIQWVAGPSKVNVNDAVGTGIAEIGVPDGYRFLPSAGARSLLTAMTNPIPDNLVGVIAPASDKWYAVLHFEKSGYIKDPAQKQLNAGMLLKLIREGFLRGNSAVQPEGRPTLGGVDWEIQPVYDPAQHRLEWAIKAGAPGNGSVNHYISILGRHGVLNITASHPYPAGKADLDFASLRSIVGGIAFKPGERYADHQSSDAAAASGLAGVIAEDKTERNAGSIWQAVIGFIQAYGLWVVAAVGLVFASCGMTVLVLRSRKPVRRHVKGNGKPAIVMAVANGEAENHENGLPSNGVAVNHPVPSRRNGKGLSRADRRRKKHFSYHAFYSDMVMNLTRCNYGGATRPLAEDGSATSNSAAPSPKVVNGPATETANLLVAEASKLIQSQQKLIEGQRKLIEEQSKLIHEKSKLIDVENRVLGKQAEGFVEQELL